jgi:transposase
MLTISTAYRYYLYLPPADMRKNFDGLSGIVTTCFPSTPISGDVFIFINRRRCQVKLLHWQGDGFAIYYKRLEKGTYELPLVQTGDQVVKLKAQELLLIIEGIALLSVKKRVRYQTDFVEKQ